MAEGQIKKIVSQYHDDLGDIWWVELRAKTIYLGEFDVFTKDEQRQLRDFNIPKYPYQQKRMRKITIKFEDGTTIEVPQARMDSSNYRSVGSSIWVPTRDTVVSTNPGGDAWRRGLIISRRGEEPGPVAIDETGAWSIPA